MIPKTQDHSGRTLRGRSTTGSTIRIGRSENDDHWVVTVYRSSLVIARFQAPGNLSEKDLVEMTSSLLAQASEQADPPAFAEFLLESFLTSKRGQALVGDMRERFGRECIELGRKRAERRYWAQTVRSLWPLLRRAIARMIKWGAFVDAFWRHWRG